MGNDSDWRFEPANESRRVTMLILTIFTLGKNSEDGWTPSDLSSLLGNDWGSIALIIESTGGFLTADFIDMIEKKN